MSNLEPGEFDTAETLGEFALGMLQTIYEWDTADAWDGREAPTEVRWTHASGASGGWLSNGCALPDDGVM